MTNSFGNRYTISLLGSNGGLENGLSPSALPRATDHFPDPPESLESNSVTCHSFDQSLFVYLHNSDILNIKTQTF